MCDEITEEKKLPQKKVPRKSTSTNLYILLDFLLVTMALLKAVIIYCLILSKTKTSAVGLNHKQQINKRLY